MKESYKIVLSWMLVIVWMGIIFAFSSKNGEISDNQSKQPVRSVVTVAAGISDKIGITKDTTEEKIESITNFLNYPIRKGAHISEYMILALLLINALSKSHFKYNQIILLTLFIGVIYSITDEYHQTFISNRSGQVMDVFIDSLGILIILFLYHLQINFKQKA